MKVAALKGGAPTFTEGPLAGVQGREIRYKDLLVSDGKRTIPDSLGLGFSPDDRLGMDDVAERYPQAKLFYFSADGWRAVVFVCKGKIVTGGVWMSNFDLAQAAVEGIVREAAYGYDQVRESTLSVQTEF